MKAVKNPLAVAQEAYGRVHTYGDWSTLTANERTILVLGDEVLRLRRIIHKHPAALADDRKTPHATYTEKDTDV